MSKVQKFEIWIADMNPGKGSEPGKVRPVVIIQSNILNKLEHVSTIVCPISSQIKDISLLRIPVEPSKVNGLNKPSSILTDQIKAVDLSRLLEKVGVLEENYRSDVQQTLALILDFDLK